MPTPSTPLNRQSIWILVFIASCVVALLAGPSSAKTLSWDGHYRNEEDEYHLSPIRAISLHQLAGNRFKVELEYNPDRGKKTEPKDTVRIVATGSVYENVGMHGFKDAMVIYYPAAHFQPIVVLKSGPISKRQDQSVLHFDFLEYTLFENSEFRSAYSGKLLRDRKMRR